MRDLPSILRARQGLQDALHTFLRERHYLAIDTPIAVISPGTEVHLQYFQSDWLDYQQKAHRLYLRSSPELHLKQALGMGFERVYHLGKCFRNGGELSPWHHPEFTMLEWYQVGITLSDFMSLTADMLQAGAAALAAEFPSILQIPKSIPRLSMFEAFENWARIPLIDGDPDLAAKGRSLGYQSLRADDSFETAYFKILLDVIEPRLQQLSAAFLYDYPASQCALAQVHHGRAQRFELYLQGVELCNAFDELLDPAANRERIDHSNAQRLQLGSERVPEDPDFFAALTRGLQPCCGNALGFDRLLALLLGEKSLDRVIPFRWNQPYAALHNQSW